MDNNKEHDLFDLEDLDDTRLTGPLTDDDEQDDRDIIIIDSSQSKK